MWTIFAYIYLKKANNDFNSVNEYWLDAIPSNFTTLGVFGTFLGIVIGLQDFNTTDIQGSIPQLLDGLKTAFWTSIYGILASIVTQKYIHHIQFSIKLNDGTLTDSEVISIGLKNIEQAIIGDQDKSILSQLVLNRTSLKDFFSDEFKNLRKELSEQKSKLDEIAKFNSIQSESIDKIEKSIGGNGDSSLLTQFQKLRDAQSILIENVNSNHKEQIEVQKESNNLLKTEFGVVNEHMATISSLIKSNSEVIVNELNNYALLFKETNTSILTQLQELSSLQSTLISNADEYHKAQMEMQEESKSVLKSELGIVSERIVSISELMKSNTELMASKFDEFSKLLEEANTDALVKAIENVIGGFNEKLSELINRLVKENFEKLNESVERLNTWQERNKEHVEALISQFVQVSNDLSVSSETLVKTASSAQVLVAEDGKLATLIEDLYEVMQEDQKFKEAIEHLRVTTDGLNSSSEKLTTVFERQSTFSETVDKLVKQFKDDQEATQKSFTKITELLSTDATLLGDISDKTKKLVDDDSQLKQIVEEFKKLSKEDNRFTKVLETSAESMKTSSEKIDDLSKKLNDWSDKQKDFYDGVENLINKLSEIEHLRDKEGGFFNDVEREFEDAANILKSANESIQNDFDQFRQTFAEGMNRSFTSLDAVLKETVLEYARRLNALDSN